MQILKEKRGYFCYLLENVIYVMQSALKATLCFIFQCSLKKKKQKKKHVQVILRETLASFSTHSHEQKNGICSSSFHVIIFSD